MKKKLSEKQVLKKLGVEKFSDVTVDKATKFSSFLAEINPDVAKKIMEQIPEFVKFSLHVVSEYKDVVIRGYDESSATTKAYLDSCKKILNSLEKELEKPLLSERKRDKIISKMIVVADKIDKKDQETKKFILWRDISIGALLFGFVSIIVSVLSFGRIKITK